MHASYNVVCEWFSLLETSCIETPVSTGRPATRRTPKTRSRLRSLTNADSPIKQLANCEDILKKEDIIEENSKKPKDEDKQRSRNSCKDESPEVKKESPVTPKKKPWPKGVPRGSPLKRKSPRGVGRPPKVKKYGLTLNVKLCSI